MLNNDGSSGLAPANGKPLFLVWGPSSRGRRSLVFARELGIEVHFICSARGRGMLSALHKYPCQAVRTLMLLFRNRPGTVFVQSPPLPAILVVYVYCKVARAKYLVDAHSAAFQVRAWRRLEFAHRHFARNALVTVVTNEHFAELIHGWNARAFVLQDIPAEFQADGPYTLQSGFNVAVANTFSEDEPLGEILAAARELPQVHFHITGDTKWAASQLLTAAAPNVHFTGFLPDGQYYALLRDAQAVMCLTTRDHTMQRGACEALSLSRPLITSDWLILRRYFSRGAVHVANTSASIRGGVLSMIAQYEELLKEISDLRAERRTEWQRKKRLLNELVQKRVW